MKYLNVKAVKRAKNYKTKLVVIAQPLSLHYVFISYNMQPHPFEFMYLEREDSYNVVVAKYEFYIRSFEA